MRKYTKIVFLASCMLIARGIAAADENPGVLWDPSDWDHARWANNATTKHLSLFVRARDARKYCAIDERVVWLDRRSGLYYLAGSVYYGETPHGRYVCERQALIIGAVPARR